MLDLELPAGRTRNTPVVVLIHSGSWSGGDKEDFPLMDIRVFTERGYATANINYRLASAEANIHDPDLSDDINAALDFVAARAEEYQVSRTRFGVVGYSAGGHLALLAGYKYDPTRRIRAVASLAGPTDLNDPLLLAVPTARETIENYLGVTQEEAPSRWTDASPVSVATASSPPTILVHGLLDFLVPPPMIQRLHERLLILRVPAQYRLISLYSHELGTFPGAGFPAQVWGPVLDWFDRYVK